VTDEALQTLPGAEGTEFTEVPHNDESEVRHRDFCAFLCESARGSVDAVFTSEDYGEGFAAHLTKRFRERDPTAARVAHVCVDRARVQVPVSGTQIRADVHGQRTWLSPCVYASFVRRVCILGGESSGKSVLAAALAAHFGTSYVPEFGRELWVSKAGELVFDDMLDIARRQVEREEDAARSAARYLFCDTSPLTTLFYSLDMYGRADPALASLARRAYDVYVLCAPDFEFVQDGTRRDAAFRRRQHEWYVEQFAHAGVQYAVARGSVETRVDYIARLLEA
jgi:NadR type nicotinamide-nucleotide adenylyltransferase